MKREENIIKKFWNKITIEKWSKVLRLVIICMVFMVISEGIFEIPAIANFFGEDLIKGKSGWMVYVIVWLVMFAQVAIIPIPALPIIVACNQIPNLVGRNFELSGLFSITTIGFVLLITSATLVGAITAYWIGRTFGKPAIKWAAGSAADYNKWSKKLNSRVGKWTYAATVLFPVFPDDLISLVVGSIKMDFGFYVVANAICKFVGAYTMLIFMRLPGLQVFFRKSTTSVPIALIAYVLILLVAITVRVILNQRINRKQPKKVKLDIIREKILYKLNRIKAQDKELLDDYKLEYFMKTYLASEIKLHKYYTVNNTNIKQKIRIIFECKASNYWQIIFDKEYDLTEKYDTVITDFKKCALF